MRQQVTKCIDQFTAPYRITLMIQYWPKVKKNRYCVQVMCTVNSTEVAQRFLWGRTLKEIHVKVGRWVAAQMKRARKKIHQDDL